MTANAVFDDLVQRMVRRTWKRSYRDRSQAVGSIKAEVYVGRCEIGWRWDVTFQRLASHPWFPGVTSCRTGLRTEFGYAKTRWGAWRAVRKAYATERVV